MKTRTLISLFFLTISFFTTSIYAQTTELGEKLERDLFTAVKEKNWQALEDKIAPYAQSINADKIRNRDELISYIKSLTFEEYQFGNFTTTQNPAGNMLVVTYTLTYKEKVDEEQSSGKETKNLSVWEKKNDQWQWIAHAVID